MLEVADGIRRVTFPLPLGIDHVHCYLVRHSDGSWLLVDAGLGLPHPEERWAPVLDALDAPITRLAITHYHPDHVGDAASVAELTSAVVLQGRLDEEQCRRTWGSDRQPERYIEHALANGLPADEADELRRETEGLARLVHPPQSPLPLEPEEELDGWRIVHLPGHADGHLALLRDGILLAGDTILDPISPIVGVYPDSRPDPLGDYLDSLRRIVELAPSVAFAGHRDPIREPAGRARELLEHHRRRLDETLRALSAEPASGYEVSHRVFPSALAPALRRFALAETLAHLERLVREERAERVGEPGRVLYRASRA
ncbi:MAG TPA: MBL fold metallo-hydrolase [Gaiellaceae bacterium]|jgi:glyoxylase-like metal-dependent hydrolase (beta-lactamase superfamily II)|nr:MBL fold metallo-hydrolase [Gaiellaceae bacterium]